MIRIEHKKGEYFIDDKKVFDELSISMQQRMALRNFKQAIESGLRIKSKTYDFKERER